MNELYLFWYLMCCVSMFKINSIPIVLSLNDNIELKIPMRVNWWKWPIERDISWSHRLYIRIIYLYMRDFNI